MNGNSLATCLPQAYDALRVAGEVLGQKLQGDLALELAVARVIDAPQAARADVAQDFILVQPGAGSERHDLTPPSAIRV